MRENFCIREKAIEIWTVIWERTLALERESVSIN